MEFKGTKGIWLVQEKEVNQFGKEYIPIATKTDNVFIDVYGVTKKETEANAKLISCAPEMLEMLIKVNTFINENKSLNYMAELLNRDTHNLKQLIEKATTI
jgi:hypothetical protein